MQGCKDERLVIPKRLQESKAIALFWYQVYDKSDITTGTKTSIDMIDNKIILQVLIKD
jgi:hypothetical protein